MKKMIAFLLTLALVFCFAACKDSTDPEETTRPLEELIAEADAAGEKLISYKTELDKQLTLVNSADNNDEFFDLAAMAEAGAAFDALFEEIGLDPEKLTDGEPSSVKNVASAKQAADQISAISAKINTAAQKYYKQFVAAYPDATMTKLYCLTVFMSGEPSSFFAAEYTDAQGAALTAYSVSSFTAATPEDVLATMHQYLFASSPVSSRDAVMDGNFNIDLDAVKAAVVDELPVKGSDDVKITDGNVISDGNAK